MSVDNYWLDLLDVNAKVSECNNLHSHLDKCKTSEEEDAVLEFWINRPVETMDDFKDLIHSGRSSCSTPHLSNCDSTSIAAGFAAAASGGGF